MLRRMAKFDDYIEKKIGDKVKKTDEVYSGFPDYRDLFNDHPDNHPIVMEEESLMPEIDWKTKEEHDERIGVEVLLEVGGEKK